MEANSLIPGTSSIEAAPVERDGICQPPAFEGSAVTCYENDVPAFVEGELERLYGNVFSSLAHFRAFGGLPADTGTYVVRKGSGIVTVFLFRRIGNQVQVLNEGMALDEESVSRFADTLFARYGSVNVISFHAVPTSFQRLPYPYQCFTCTEDIVLDLPGTTEAWLAGLGKNTRRNIKRYMDKLLRAHASFRFDFYEKDAVDEQHLHAIVGFSRKRIAGKNKAFAIDDTELEQIIELVRARGLVGVATIEGRVCGGTIGYLIGDSFYFRVVSHDPQYNDFSTGILCCYLAIRECIERGCKQFNFMQDGYDYKFALGAVVRKLDHVAIYRSRAAMLRNARLALKLAAQARARKIKTGLLDAARKREGHAGRLVSGVLGVVRKLRGLASGSTATPG